MSKRINNHKEFSSSTQKQETTVVEPSKKSKLIKIVNLISFPILTFFLFAKFLPFLYSFDYSVLPSKSQALYNIINDLSIETTSNESVLLKNLRVILTSLLLLGLYLLILIKMTILSRIISKNEGLHKESHSFTVMLNCNIQNSIEQIFIFISLFSYLLFTNAPSNQIIKFIVIGFFLSRIIYSLGCLMSYFTGVYALRSCGFFVGSAINFYIICIIFKITPPFFLDLSRLF